MNITKPFSMDELVVIFDEAYEAEWTRVADLAEDRSTALRGGADNAATRAGITAVLAHWEAT